MLLERPSAGFRLLSDVFSVVVLLGIVYFLLRRLLLPSRADLRFHDNILLHPQVAAGAVKIDSLIVAVFILLHVGARFLGESVAVAQAGYDGFMPFASAAFGNLDEPKCRCAGGATAWFLVDCVGRHLAVSALFSAKQTCPSLHGAA